MQLDEKNPNNLNSSLTSDIMPLQRNHKMNFGAANDAGSPPNKNQNNSTDCPNMYPGFGSLLTRQMNPNPPPFAAASAKATNHPGIEEDQYLTAENRKAIHKDERNKEKIVGAEKEPEGRKRRRRSNLKDDSHSPTEQTTQHDTHISKPHVYHDYSGLSGGPVILPTLAKKGRGGVSSMFPTVLHHMLEDAEKLGFDDVVSWLPHGRAFHVHQPEKFVTDVMPKYFRHTRLSSFQRQLSLYGFTRLARKGPDRGAYYHECFLRGLTHLCSSMQRTRVKGTMVRQSSNPGTEPDFSTMPPLRPGEGGLHRVQVPQPPRTKETEDAFDVTNTVGSLSMPPLGVDEQGEISYKVDKQDNTSKSPSLEDKLMQEALRLQPGNDDSNDLQFHPWGSKYMRHLQTLSNPLRVDTAKAEQNGSKRSSANTEDKESDSTDSSSSSSGNNQPNNHEKVDADLVGFLEEVDLESDQDECLVEEEAMERILEQEEEVKISEV